MTIEIPWKESSSSTHLTWEKTWSAHNFRICPVFCQSVCFPDPPSLWPYSCSGWILQGHFRGAELHQDEVQEHPHIQPRGHSSHGGGPEEAQEEGACGLDLPATLTNSESQNQK